MLTPEQMAACLRFDPFEDDLCSEGTRLADKVVRTRKAATCFTCAGAIQPGEHSRVMTAQFDGAV